jgi:hypothetical protein
MAFSAIIPGYNIKGLFPVMAQPAELAFCKQFHVHFIGSSAWHFKGLVVAIIAFGTLDIDVVFMLEENLSGALRVVLNVTTAYFSKDGNGKQQDDCCAVPQGRSSHDVPPLSFMTSPAILFRLRVKSFQPVMAVLAEIPLGHLFVFHLEAVSWGSEGLEVAGGTLYPSGFYVVIMTE